ncbi:MAG: sigma-70 family RNA polymerase sigma factor [Candidatus Altiarchaeales archaeon]|nr:sigma-70 family RNA polymerase sigma factor [Candidatus Altiarchaeales archaeon]
MTCTGIEGLPPDDWLAANKGQVEAIVRTVTGRHKPDDEQVPDIVGRIIYTLLNNRALSRYDPKRASLRVYFFTCVCNLLGGGRYYNKKREAERNTSTLLIEPKAGEWVSSSDMRIDLDRWVQHCLDDARPQQNKILKMLLKGYSQSEIAKHLHISRQRVSVYTQRIRRDYEEWSKENQPGYNQ